MPQSHKYDERGVAILEFGILSTLLLLFLSVSIDFARAFVQHTAISRIAYETARFASALPQPVFGTCGSNNMLVACPGAWEENVRNRMLTLANLYVVTQPQFFLADPRITKVIACNPAARTITIAVNFPFNPITPGFNYVTQTTETVVGPSLFWN